MRKKLIASGEYTHEMFRFARSFAESDEVVIAAPCWDLSFPAAVKLYLEQLCISGLTFRYTEQGIPAGLTKVSRVTYITTAGGYIRNNLGFDYIKALFEGLFSIRELRCISAEGLDIQGNVPEQILNRAITGLSGK